MAKFAENTRLFCGYSCATAYDDEDSAGVALRFTKPYDPCDDREVETVSTTAGNIYLKFAQSNKYGDKRASERHRNLGLKDVEHYSCSEITGKCFEAQVGVVLFINLGQYYLELASDSKLQSDKDYYKRTAALYDVSRAKLEISLEGILLYKSPPFYNSVHHERTYPSCTLYIYDKEMKNESPV